MRRKCRGREIPSVSGDVASPGQLFLLLSLHLAVRFFSRLSYLAWCLLMPFVGCLTALSTGSQTCCCTNMSCSFLSSTAAYTVFFCSVFVDLKPRKEQLWFQATHTTCRDKEQGSNQSKKRGIFCIGKGNCSLFLPTAAKDWRTDTSGLVIQAG